VLVCFLTQYSPGKQLLTQVIDSRKELHAACMCLAFIYSSQIELVNISIANYVNGDSITWQGYSQYHLIML